MIRFNQLQCVLSFWNDSVYGSRIRICLIWNFPDLHGQGFDVFAYSKQNSVEDIFNFHMHMYTCNNNNKKILFWMTWHAWWKQLTWEVNQVVTNFAKVKQLKCNCLQNLCWSVYQFFFFFRYMHIWSCNLFAIYCHL